MSESFTWADGERLIRFGEGALAEAPALLAARGFDGYALLTTARAERDAPELVAGAARVAHVPRDPFRRRPRPCARRCGAHRSWPSAGAA